MRRPRASTPADFTSLDYPRDGGRSRSRSPGADRDGDTRIRDDSYSGRGERYDAHQSKTSEQTTDILSATSLLLARTAAATAATVVTVVDHLATSTRAPTSSSPAFTRV